MHFIGMMAFLFQDHLCLYILFLTFYLLLYRFAYNGGFYRLYAFYRHGFDFPGNYCVDPFLFAASVLAVIAPAFRLFKNFLLFDVKKNI
ncbi:hypothetical protein [Bacillus atrophaeus]|uniref:hypothetical protein n=1 Tax=Bacillus atrophaeus TaxID=1452 RepID=UPI00255B91A1|nr:hypothetical protein [Bacillus atrophaeus]MDL5141067.1 hypothetical protein [Bacillus atrophaeus]